MGGPAGREALVFGFEPVRRPALVFSLFFRYDSRSADIIYAWVNDHRPLRGHTVSYEERLRYARLPEDAHKGHSAGMTGTQLLKAAQDTCSLQRFARARLPLPRRTRDTERYSARR